MNRRRPKDETAAWIEPILEEWARQMKTRPRVTVTVTPGGAWPENMGKFDSPSKPTPSDEWVERGIFPAHGVATARNGPPEETMLGYIVRGLTGVAARADRVMLTMAGCAPRCAWVLRAEFGLIPELSPDADHDVKGSHLGAYLDGRPWPARSYLDRLIRGRQLFTVGYLCAQ